MNNTFEVALLVSLESDWHRSIVLGVADYAQSVGNWKFVAPGFDTTGKAKLANDWKGDGIICRQTSPELEKQIAALNLPTVNVSWLNDWSLNVARVVSDEAACAKMAAQFYVDKQLQNFAYVGFPPWKNYEPIAERTLRDCFRHAEFHFDVFPMSPEKQMTHGIDLASLKDWLEALPKPNGIIVWSSEIGRFVTQMCMESKIVVPDEVSVLCIEHDPLWSSLAEIPLSNIDQDPWRVGYSAAKTLFRMMRGGAVEAPILIPPIGISQRQSTNTNALSDSTLKHAITYIKNNIHQGISVNEVANQLDISRRTLESKFKEGLKNTPGAYIRKIQLQMAATLLRRTTLNLSEIAAKTGFSYTEVLMRSFKREYGVTPMQFRGAGSR